MLASPATESPATTPTASGRKIGSSRARAANATNRPLPVMALTKSGPRPESGAETRTAMASTIGTTASTARPARFRRRPPMIRSSEARKRSEIGEDRAGLAGSCTTWRVSAADIEPLAGQGDKDVLEARAAHREAEDGHVGVHQVRHDLGHLDLAQGGAHPVRQRHHVGQAQLGEHPG